ncbi:hypothetical protein BC831DRAFT_554059 [Entophlyctis helioformis]|nr:hypothetical protein BC831DRAFT_554059 [Entophlyctis helioformis]
MTSSATSSTRKDGRLKYTKGMLPAVMDFDIRLANDTILLSHDPAMQPPSPPAGDAAAGDAADGDAAAGDRSPAAHDKDGRAGQTPLAAYANARLSGSVRLSLLEPLDKVRSIEFRFVGGVVSRLDDAEASLSLSGLNCNLRGTDRLFDKQISLYNGAERGSVLEAKVHEFDFSLRLPAYMPPSVHSKHIQVQYLLVAAVHFESSCCGLQIPYFNRPSLVSKHEVIVRRDPYVHDGFEWRVGLYQDDLTAAATAGADADADADANVDKPLLVISRPDAPHSDNALARSLYAARTPKDATTVATNSTSSLGSQALTSVNADGDADSGIDADMDSLATAQDLEPRATIVWTPNNDILARIPTCLELKQDIMPLQLFLAGGYTPIMIEWSLIQEADYKFKYNVTSEKINSKMNEIGDKAKRDRDVVSTGVLSEFPAAFQNENNESELMLQLDIGSGTQPRVELVEDIESAVARVLHVLLIELTVSKGGSAPETFVVTCPVHMYRKFDMQPYAQTLKAMAAVDRTDVAMPSTVAASSTAAAPAAEPATSTGSGLRRRK